MSEAAIAKLRAEADRLRRVIADAQTRLDEIRELIRLLEKFGSVIEQRPVDIETAALNAIDKVVRRHQDLRRPSTQKDRITNACEIILSDGRRRMSRALLVDLRSRGIEVPGNDPATNLASYLSRDERFVSNKRLGGWTLASLETVSVSLEFEPVAERAGGLPSLLLAPATTTPKPSLSALLAKADLLQKAKPGSAPTLPGLFTNGASEEGPTRAAGSTAAGGDEIG